MNVPLVIAGVDSSDASHVAAIWAAHAARYRNGRLQLIQTYEPPIAYAAPGAFMNPQVLESTRSWGQHELHRSMQLVQAACPGLDVESSLLAGSAVSVLRQAATGADLLVVGSHGMGVIGETLLGSVAQRLVGRCPVPVTVVRDDPHDRTAAEPRTDGPVLVGLDGSESSALAMEFAVNEAARRSVDLVAVRAWDPQPLTDFLRAYPLEENRKLVDQQEQTKLEAQLAGWPEKFPTVQMRTSVQRGRPSGAMLRYGVEIGASQFVVGTRGRGGFVGLLLGSTSRELVGYAPCPVTVVPDPHQ